MPETTPPSLASVGFSTTAVRMAEARGLLQALPGGAYRRPMALRRSSRRWIPALPLVLGSAASARAHGGAEVLVALGLLLAVAAGVLLAAFSFFYVLFSAVSAFRPLSSRAAWAAGAVGVCVVAIVSAPQAVLPLSVRLRAARMDRLFPDMTRTGFHAGEVPELIALLGAGGDDAAVASAVLCGFGDRAVPALTNAVDDPDAWRRAHAVNALGCIGATTAPLAPTVVAMLARETNTLAQVYELEFLEHAAGWEGRERWVDGARPVLIEYLDRPGHIAGNAAVVLGALGADAAPAVPALRRVVAERTGPKGDDRFVREKAADAVRAICTHARTAPGC